MPRGDGTGPMGLGPMTGRAAGYCAGYAGPGFANPAFGFGWGGRGCRGLGNRYRDVGFSGRVCFPGFARNQVFFTGNSPDPEGDAKILGHQIEMMEQSLKAAKERLEELKKSDE